PPSAGFHMSSFRPTRSAWVIVCILTCTIVVLTGYLRWNDTNYAESVSSMDWQLCQDSQVVDKTIFCHADRKHTFNMMHVRFRNELATTTTATAVVAIIIAAVGIFRSLLGSLKQ